MSRKRRRPQGVEPRTTQIVEAGQVIPSDGTVIDGIASVDESAMTGESAPVIRCAADSERSMVTAGTRVVSGRIVIEI